MWSPADLSPPAWWRADLGHALVDADPVPSWANQGTVSPLPFEAAGAYQPTYVAWFAAANSQAAMAFDGNNVMGTPTWTGWHMADGDSFVFIQVHVPLVTTGTKTVVRTALHSTRGGILTRSRVGGVGTWAAVGSSASGNTSPNGVALTADTLAVQAGVFTGAVSTAHDSMRVWTNGVAGTALTADVAAVQASVASEWFLGGLTGTSPDLTSHVCEIIFVPRLLTAAEDTSLTGYLNTRYGLALPGVTR